MATYKQILDWVKLKYGFVPKTCWIADVKQKSGLQVRIASNRISHRRVYPCPKDKGGSIKAALKHFNMV